MGLSPERTFTYATLIPVAGLVGCMIAVMTTDTVGRRTLCYIGAALATMFGALIGAIGSKPNANQNTTDSNVVIASVILLNGVCKLGVASQCWLIGSEIGGVRMRKKMLGWGVVVDVFAAFLVTFFTPYLQAGPHVQLGAKVGYIFMGLAALSFFFFIFFTPELKGRSLEEADELFEVRNELNQLHIRPAKLTYRSSDSGHGNLVKPKLQVLELVSLRLKMVMMTLSLPERLSLIMVLK